MRTLPPAADWARYSSSWRTFSGSRPPPETVPIRRLNSTKVSRAVRSTALRDPSEGGFSSPISSLRARPVRMRKSLTAVVMLASSSKASCRRRISAAASRYLGSVRSKWRAMLLPGFLAIPRLPV